jgi:uncharacterized membrane protein
MVRIIVAGLGGLMMLSGRVMGQLEPNGLIGIRTRATLNDPLVWARVHKAAGPPFLALGGALILGAILNLPAPLLLAILVLGLITSTGVAMLRARKAVD